MQKFVKFKYSNVFLYKVTKFFDCRGKFTSKEKRTSSNYKKLLYWVVNRSILTTNLETKRLFMVAKHFSRNFARLKNYEENLQDYPENTGKLYYFIIKRSFIHKIDWMIERKNEWQEISVWQVLHICILDIFAFWGFYYAVFLNFV